ncbi:importin 13 [Cavenderia fasciculata]|uniref:Importin 13 n=1 Tax=Cavenderia fasciculata TaxID=261658 RepID=F4QE26_CACFS|nr:importin 13 [Cavenderia fasciculata]EGG13973.1 importin 13 [Cavenderia fasciculata]|eukprot:XP_004350681.1 importin 13 [Cavenderia fasciculata]
MPPFQALLSPIIGHVNQYIQTKAKNIPFLKIQLEIYQHTTKIIELDDQEDTGKHPLLPFLQAIIPQLKQLLETNLYDYEIVELISAIYRWTLLFCRNVVSELAPEIITQATLAYQKNPLPYLLQVINACASSTKLPIETENKLKESLSIISATTLSLLREETIKLSKTLPQEYAIDPQYHLNFSIRPDITKDYLLLIQSTYTYSPQCLNPNIVSTLVIYIIHNVLDLKDLSTVRNTFNFLSLIIMSCKSKDERHKVFGAIIDEIIAVHGKVLIKNLLIGVSRVFPTTFMNTVSEVLFSYSSSYPTPFRREAKIILVQSPFLDDVVAPCDRQIFLSQLQRTDNKNEYRFAIQTFSILFWMESTLMKEVSSFSTIPLQIDQLYGHHSSIATTTTTTTNNDTLYDKDFRFFTEIQIEQLDKIDIRTSFASKLIFFLSISDLMVAISYYPFGRLSKTFCDIQGIGLMFFLSSSYFWTMCISISVYFVFFLNQVNINHLMKYFHIISWGVPFATTLIAMLNYDIFGRTGSW